VVSIDYGPDRAQKERQRLERHSCTTVSYDPRRAAVEGGAAVGGGGVGGGTHLECM